MAWGSDLPVLARLLRDAGPFLRTPVAPAAAEGLITSALAARPERFLRFARQAIYAHRASPYRTLLRAAGCEYGDLKSLVHAEGVEGALQRLAAAGVYVTLDEFKGRREAVRGSQRFRFRAADFDNPRVKPHVAAQSGGTRGTGTAVRMSFAFIAALAANTAAALQTHGLVSAAHAVWLNAGITPVLLYAKLGRPPVAWFYAVRPLAPRSRLGAWLLALLGQVNGVPLPRPVFHDLMHPAGMARWLARRAAAGPPLCLTTYASSAVRVARAARAEGLDLSGVSFITLGEPFTAARAQIIAGSGAHALVRYAFTEGGIVGYGCGAPAEPDDLHLFSDAFALVQHRRTAAPGPAVDAFLLTSLRSSTPKVLLNAETGDYGTVEHRSCACRLGRLGLTTHLWGIRSFEKLSTEGMTFAYTNLLRVLEEILPERFGGAPTDYQLIEQEEDGVARLRLLVSPDVGPLPEGAVRELFLRSLQQEDGAARLGTAILRRAGALEIRRDRPLATAMGKILPLHLVPHGP
jgi:hypothetical protein